MKNYLSLLAIVSSFAFLQWGCNSASADDARIGAMVNSSVADAMATTSHAVAATSDPAMIMNRPEVPILCYHQIRDWKVSDSKTAKDYIVPLAAFRDQMKALADSGFHTISPDQLLNYLTKGASLPSKPVMITFDDTRADQYTAALPELNKYGFKGVFFIMTVSLGRPGYMAASQVKQLSDEGHTIGSHTWDHKSVKKYTADDWAQQIQKPSKQLHAITGKPVDYFAYPFGLWNKEAVSKLKQYEFKAVFQLSDLRDANDPLYTIRRIIVPGNWAGGTMIRVMKRSF
jgi:peptidoglycan/xylan/chitin deacetylase (PgdA/CDA1 family)